MNTSTTILIVCMMSVASAFGALGGGFTQNIAGSTSASPGQVSRTPQVGSQEHAGVWSAIVHGVQASVEAAGRAATSLSWSHAKARTSFKRSLNALDEQIADLEASRLEVEKYQRTLESERAALQKGLAIALEKQSMTEVLPTLANKVRLPTLLESYPLTRSEKRYALRQFRETAWGDLPDSDALATAFGEGPRRELFTSLFTILQKEVGKTRWTLRDEQRVDTGVRALFEAQASSDFSNVSTLLRQGGFIDAQGQPSRFAKTLLATEGLYAKQGLSQSERAQFFSYSHSEAENIVSLRGEIARIKSALAIVDDALEGDSLRSIRLQLSDAEAGARQARQALLVSSKTGGLEAQTPQTFFAFVRQLEADLQKALTD